jgi:hypothetical protein
VSEERTCDTCEHHVGADYLIMVGRPIACQMCEGDSNWQPKAAREGER